MARANLAVSGRHATWAVALGAVVLGSCATVQDPWAIHERANPKAAQVNGSPCPVVLTNQTGFQLSAGYLDRGAEAPLGYLPDGQSLHFEVSCLPGDIVAFAESAAGAPSDFRYRKAMALDPRGSTRLTIRESDRIR